MPTTPAHNSESADRSWLATGARVHDAATGRTGIVHLLRGDDGALRTGGIPHATRALLRPLGHGQPWWARTADLHPDDPGTPTDPNHPEHTPMRTPPVLLWLTGDDTHIRTAWKDLTTALGTRTDISMTTYAYPARHLSLAGCRVLRLELSAHTTYIREATAHPDLGWTFHTGHPCPAEETVPLALHLATESQATGGLRRA
ncbi:hypothetical protein [Streptomyces aidingensis]|uniref:Uncharacterized protein n=1 Tax=Streptomyces aidingensis TaxID=910347 RepID=A0A1I1QYG5_9ACTN|nr:hypothetical protein [Streptomyces aidingensis]SFD27146.1 hypothetical protein SAMN05421773_11285 [Streptomyces aidingensis]